MINGWSLTGLILLALALPVLAHQPEERELPLEADETLAFTVDEATWLSVDVAPGGDELVIEVLGDLYTLPIDGGTARLLTSGMAFDSQPRYSPDGAHIAFISDRDGAEELWVVEIATGKFSRLSDTPDRTEFASPTWSPDGEFVTVSRGDWELRTFELWAYALSGGRGVQITQSKAQTNTPARDRHNALGAVYDPDGRFVYYARKAGGMGYNLRRLPWQIARRDLQRGVEDVLTNAQGGAVRPLLSPDGEYLVYGTRFDAQTGLRVRHLSSGSERWLVYPVERDDQESRYTRDLLPGYAFSPDGSSVIVARHGGLSRVDFVSGEVTPIPFTVDVKQPIAQRLAFSQRVGLGPVKARVLADPQLSPQGDRVAFAAFSRIYVYDFPAAEARAVSPPDINAAMPAWSPDGRRLTYVSWSDGQGHLYKQRARPGARPVRLSQRAASYSYPVWSPDGERIVALRGAAQARLGAESSFGPAPGADVVWLPAGGGVAQVVVPSRGLSRPHFGPEPDRIYLYLSHSALPMRARSGLVSVRFDGTDRREEFKVSGPGNYRTAADANPEYMQISPDGHHVLFKHAHQIYVARRLPHMSGQTFRLTKPAGPLVKLTDVGADYASWDSRGSEIVWSVGDHLYRRALTGLEFEREPPDEAEDAATGAQQTAEADASVVQRRLDVYLPRFKPAGRIALIHGTVITMSDAGVLRDATILIEGDRIEAIGDAGLTIPESATVIDLQGRVVLPGFVDTHAHFRVDHELPDTQPWSFLANLAYGVTTGMDVQPTTVSVLAAKSLVDAGLAIGPRAFSTGPGVFNNNEFDSQSHARAVLDRYARHYGVRSVKAYLAGSRKQRQWLIQAARDLDLMPTTEGAMDMKLQLSYAIDGFSGLEHNYPLPRLYDDVVQLTARTGIGYTPTLLVSYGGPQTENYFYTHDNPHHDAKLRRFTPYPSLARRTLRRSWFHDQEFVTDTIADSARRILEAGGRVGVGAHGQLQGLGYHWEMWALTGGGLAPMEVLRMATLGGAEMLGMAQDLGSLEAGKLADLVVLDGDPRDDIRQTNTVHWVMTGGVLYRADTLHQVWPENKPLPEPWWRKWAPTSPGSTTRGEN